MSYEAMTWAMKIIEQNQDWKTPRRFVLLILANRADEEGNLHPSVKWIMDRTGLAESTVREATRDLQRLRLLNKETREREGGGHTSNLYRLAMGQFVLKLERPPSYGPPGVHGGPGAVHQVERAGPLAGPQEKKEKTKERKKGMPLPDGFGISPAVREWAKKRGYEPFLDLHIEYLTNWVKQNPGDWCADWDARFRNSVMADWGGVRKQAQIAARHGHGSVPTSLDWWKSNDGIRAMGEKNGVAVPAEKEAGWFVFYTAQVWAAAGPGPWVNERDVTTYGIYKKLIERQAAHA